MKKTSGIILIVAIVSMIYGYWGAFTRSGNKVYDEMDAMLPFLIFIFGVILLIVFLAFFILKRKKERAK